MRSDQPQAVGSASAAVIDVEPRASRSTRIRRAHAVDATTTASRDGHHGGGRRTAPRHTKELTPFWPGA